jgi:hypothetical protein
MQGAGSSGKQTRSRKDAEEIFIQTCFKPFAIFLYAFA